MVTTGLANKTISPNEYDAVISDLDGVITRTATVHASAWKAMFDEFLKRHAHDGKRYERFEIEFDYYQYVDGKPRYEGVKSFLEARGIDLPFGNPDDPSDRESICGLGNRKNELFLEKLHSKGVDVYESTVDLIRTFRRCGARTAVISSSRNCKAVLEAAGIADLFDTRVDGNDLQMLDLAGKPEPDMFTEACRRLDCEPGQCVAMEDALAGVQAAKAAGLGCIVAINRGHQAEALYERGADIVVDDIEELHPIRREEARSSSRGLPSALDFLQEIVPDDGREPALFLDYDGTLTPIVSHPEDALLSDNMRSTIRRLSTLCTVAVISGRDLADVRNRVGIESIWYSGCHGFDIGGPSGQHAEHREGREYLPALDAAEQTLKRKLSAVKGCVVERKRFSVTTHYRQVAADDIARVKQVVDSVHASQSGLRLSAGKKILELQPDINWDKGKALRWLIQTLAVDTSRAMPVYIGDDVTDEDGFREVEGIGVGIVVASAPQRTRAHYHLDDPAAVEEFLNRVADRLECPS